MTLAVVDNYEAAQALIKAGKWSVDPVRGIIYGVKGQPLTRRNSKGYIQIKFRDANNWRVEHAVVAHRVIWEYQHGPLAPDMVINHINGNKTDNTQPNLEAVTVRENSLHAWATGLMHAAPRRGADSPHATMTEDTALEVYARVHAGETSAQVARDLNLKPSTVRNLKRGASWASVTGHP